MALSSSEAHVFLRPTFYIDSDHTDVIQFARDVVAGETDAAARAIALFNAVRDGIRYDPYNIDFSPAAMRASAVLQRRQGFCVPKAVLLAAVARAEGIPSRLGFADVRNHLTTERLRQLMQTDVFVFHGYADLYLHDQWVKATPAFNASLCERFNVEPLAFDGRHDALLQQTDRKGNQYMEYLHDRGRYADLPLDTLRRSFEETYPLAAGAAAHDVTATFEDDALRQGDSR